MAKRNKFQEMKERADVLQDLVNAMSWTKEGVENNVQSWTEKLGEAEANGEDTEWQEENLERYKYRLSVIEEVEKMMEKLL